MKQDYKITYEGRIYSITKGKDKWLVDTCSIIDGCALSLIIDYHIYL